MGEMHAGFWWGNLKEKYHLEDLSRRRLEIVKTDVQEIEWGRRLD
jgi:hypothetical protein